MSGQLELISGAFEGWREGGSSSLDGAQAVMEASRAPVKIQAPSSRINGCEQSSASPHHRSASTAAMLDTYHANATAAAVCMHFAR